MSYTLVRHLRRLTSISYQIRWESTLTNLTEDLAVRPPFTQWSKIIREAEKIVGYPTSFMNLRWLLSDEFSNMALYLRKLVGSNHPLLQTAKNVLYNEHNHLQPWGLIILLLSKSVKPVSITLQDTTTAENQRILAELTEMIRTGNLVHKGLINIPVEERVNSKDTALFGNKIAILIGDYLLVTANGMLARLKNQDLSYIISTALRDLSEGEFYGDRDVQNMPLPSKPDSKSAQIDEYNISNDMLPIETVNTQGYAVREWTVRALFSGGSLLGRGCQGAMLLGEQNGEMQETAYLFGCHLCLAWQAANELQKLMSSKDVFSLVSAPVLFALNDNPELYEQIEEIKVNRNELDFERFKLDVLKTDAVERTKILYEDHARKAKMYIDVFGDNQSVSTIKSLINVL